MRTVLKSLAVVSAMVFMLVAGIKLGANPSLLPAPLRSLSTNADGATFNQALGLIKRDYYRPVDDAKLQDAGVSGAVALLKDRYSNYFDPKSYAVFQNHQSPHFSGIGLDVRFVRDGLLVSHAYPGTPASAAGIKPGEMVVSVDGKPLKGKGGEAAVGLIQGQPGSVVTVGVRGKDGAVRTLKVKRARIAVPSVESKLFGLQFQGPASSDTPCVPQKSLPPVARRSNPVRVQARPLLQDLRRVWSNCQKPGARQ
jgi:carboxyl-terminal processing protease